MDDDLIIAALQQGVTAAVAACDDPTLPVEYLDVAFDKPDSSAWLEIVWIPNNRNGDFWGAEKNYQGILRLVLHCPVVQAGIYTPLELLKSIAAYFTKDRDLSGVKIYETPDFTGALREPSEVLYPVSMRYQSYRS